MKIDNLNPFPKEKVPFKLSSYKIVPKKSGCYTMTTYDGDVLYIGFAVDLNKRFLQHLDNPEKTNPTVYGVAVWFYYLDFDAKNLPMLERTWINQYQNVHGKLPVLNKVNSPI